MNLACVLCRMTLPEALVAATINAGETADFHHKDQELRIIFIYTRNSSSFYSSFVSLQIII